MSTERDRLFCLTCEAKQKWYRCIYETKTWPTGDTEYLLCTPPGRRLGTAKGGERARPGGGHSILLTIHDLHI